jgi:hypothetical protein|nr:MAG TPA: hypothetical protein [Caudoviricetes sp.]
MSQFIGTSMPRGFAGEITRGFFDFTTEVHKNNGTVKAFGVPVKLDGQTVAATTANTDAVYGFVVREYGQVDAAGVQKADILTILRRGYMVVKTAGGTPALGGTVYLKTDGTITADEGTNTAIPGCTFMSAADASGLVEIAFNI